MLGNSAQASLRGRLIQSCGKAFALAVLVILAAGCAASVSQSKATGEDGRYKGAKKVPLENNEGSARGIVTYPGGDRVDWKLIELPEEKKGSLELKLRWKPPRPGLDLTFDVYDEWGRRVAGVKPRKRSRKTSKAATLDGAKGKYYVQIYASERGDAGKYTLDVKFTEGSAAPKFDPSALQIPDPPRLPAVPEPPKPCDPDNFDKKNPACKIVCPTQVDPAWPGCKDKCPNPPTEDNPACWSTMKCPNPAQPNKRIKDCEQYIKIIGSVKGRIINVQATGNETIITINRGSDQAVADGWTGRVLSRGSGSALTGGNFVVTRVTKKQCTGRVRLTVDTLEKNQDVELIPPPQQ